MSLEEIADGADQFVGSVDLYVMSRPGEGDELAVGELVAQRPGALFGEDVALGAADHEGRARDALGIRPGSAGQPEPARVELVAPAAVGVLIDRVLGDAAAERLARVHGVRKEAVAIDGVLASGVTLPKAERQSKSAAVTLGTSPRWVEQDERGRQMARCVIERHMGAHRVADERGGALAEVE